MSTDAYLDTRVLVLAPAGRDAELARSVLADSDITAVVCRDMETFCDELEAGAAAGILTEEMLLAQRRAPLVEALGKQPLWADVPLIVLASRPSSPKRAELLTRALADLGNTTLLDRPLHPDTLVSTVRGALRARARQYQARELLSRLEQAVIERDRFLAILSHELRNPLGAMRNAMHLARRLLTNDSKLERPIAIVDRQITHLARLIDDLLDVSRVTTGKVILQKRTVDLRTVVKQSMLLLESQFEQHGLQAFSALGPRPLWIDGDSVRLEQVMTNLLMNAIKYTPAGGRIEVTAGTDGNGVWARVRDTGIGIEESMLNGIFDLFSQADRSLDRAQGGMGIGLTLVKSLVELHGGTVAATSAGLGCGSEFTLRLPATDSSGRVDSQPNESSPKAHASQRVLLVEDSEDNRELLRELLEMDGFEVEVAVDGPEGVKQALSSQPDIAIVDIGLPEMDGFEVARQVRAVLGGKIRLVALTGYGQPEDHHRTTEAGFDAHLTKPVHLADLESALRPHG
jgi:signal transduction histidine kinase/CheY-like chemotaxis protein